MAHWELLRRNAHRGGPLNISAESEPMPLREQQQRLTPGQQGLWM